MKPPQADRARSAAGSEFAPLVLNSSQCLQGRLCAYLYNEGFGSMLTLIKRTAVLRAAMLAVAACTLLACGGGGGSSLVSDAPPAPAAVTPSVTYVGGIVKNAAGIPVAGAMVSASGQTATTGTDGSYKLDASASGDNTVVLVKKSGFTTRPFNLNKRRITCSPIHC